MGFLVVALAVVGCGDGDADGVAAPAEVVDEMFGAVANGDNETWRALHATDATVSLGDTPVVPLFGPFDGILDDFDGDGVASLADDLQSRHALHGPAGQRMEWECAPNADGRVECLVESTDAMIELGGGGTLAVRTRYTIENGKIAHVEIVGPVDPAQASAVDAAFERALGSYELWVRRQHPGRYGDAFREPCCRGAMIRTVEAIALHSELIAEFLAAS